MAAIDAQPRSAAVTAMHRARLLRITGATFVEMVTHSPVLSARLMRVFTARIRTGNARLVEHSALTSKFRLYAELLRLARPRAGTEDLVVSPPPVQQVLASRIGVRREAVSREMAELIRKGVLARTPTALLILKPEALKQAIDAELES
jgi:CRP-like cAMP-binding protein